VSTWLVWTLPDAVIRRLPEGAPHSCAMLVESDRHVLDDARAIALMGAGHVSIGAAPPIGAPSGSCDWEWWKPQRGRSRAWRAGVSASSKRRT
jgi:hypothetical protein